MNRQAFGKRVLTSLACAFVGWLVSVVVTIALVFATPAFHLRFPASHAVVLLITFVALVAIGGLIGLVFPTQAQNSGSSLALALANLYQTNSRRSR
jgi:uncharacterized RDD family membrane protein YckC